MYCLEDDYFYLQLPTLTKVIGDSYPGHFKWLDNTFLKGLQLTTERGYSFAIDFDRFIGVKSKMGIVGTHQLAGCSLLKNSPEEKKLCCLFVDPTYRKRGIASHLVEDSFEVLNTDKPLMTVSEHNVPQLQKLIDRYGFELTSVKESIYKPGVKEYYYNEGLAR